MQKRKPLIYTYMYKKIDKTLTVVTEQITNVVERQN